LIGYLRSGDTWKLNFKNPKTKETFFVVIFQSLNIDGDNTAWKHLTPGEARA
jgi:hypothetical protein